MNVSRFKLYRLVLFSLLVFFPLSGAQKLKPSVSNLEYDDYFESYVTINFYETKEDTRHRSGTIISPKKLLYLVLTVESGRAIGQQLFWDFVSGAETTKYGADGNEKINGKNYHVYKHGKHLVYHDFDDEFIIIP